jgi:hypothetical protein
MGFDVRTMSSRPSYEHDNDTITSCVLFGFGFGYTAARDDCACRGKREMLCCTESYCCDGESEPLAVCWDFDPDNPNEICKFGCYCCEHAFAGPRMCYGEASRVFCVQHVVVFPCFDADYMDDAACAICCWSCYPAIDCGAAAPKCKALEDMQTVAGPRRQRMERGDSTEKTNYELYGQGGSSLT